METTRVIVVQFKSDHVAKLIHQTLFAHPIRIAFFRNIGHLKSLLKWLKYSIVVMLVVVVVM